MVFQKYNLTKNNMDIKQFTEHLSESASVIEDILKHVTQEQAQWKPAPGKWSILEVVNHLYDEEIEDFSDRLDMVLHHPGEEWKPNNPEAWVTEREYNKRDFDKSLANFLNERRKSVTWLSQLSSPDLNLYYEHPNFAKITAGDILYSWLAHDYLHQRQIINIKLKHLAESIKPYSIKYAG
jgi:hypothetical protein